MNNIINDFVENKSNSISITDIMRMYCIDTENLSEKKRISKMFREKFDSYRPQKKNVERVLHFYCIHKDEIENPEIEEAEIPVKSPCLKNKNTFVIKKHLDSEFYSMKLSGISAKIMLCKAKTGIKYNDIHLQLIGYEKLLYNDKGFCDVQFYPFIFKGNNKDRIAGEAKRFGRADCIACCEAVY